MPHYDHPVTGMTPCQKEYLEATGGPPGMVGQFIPTCYKDGSYAPLQCHASTGYCWCVTSDGKKIPNTTLAAPKRPNCKYLNCKTFLFLFIYLFFLGDGGGVGRNICYLPSSVSSYIEFPASLSFYYYQYNLCNVIMLTTVACCTQLFCVYKSTVRV